VDLNHRPLSYEPIEACQTIQEQGITAWKTLHLVSKFSAGLGWFCTPFPHTRIEETAACAKLVSDCAGTLWWIIEKGELTGGYTIHPMATHAAIPLSEYLATSYRPDRDYVDGELQERDLGEREHALLQLILGSIFRNNRHVWNITAMTELRVQVISR
jgi:hypothetical protein